MNQNRIFPIILNSHTTESHRTIMKFLDSVEQVTVDGQRYFAVKDIARELGYRSSSYSSLVTKGSVKKILPLERGTGERNTAVVPLSGVIELIISSRMNTAIKRKLMEWIVMQAAEALNQRLPKTC